MQFPWFKKSLRGAPATEQGERIYAIGDVHGCYDLFIRLLELIAGHNAALPTAKSRIIILGDIIDRGDDSDKFLTILVHGGKIGSLEILRGNHEAAMLAAIEGDVHALHGWLSQGGLETLKSLNIMPPQPEEDGLDFCNRLRSNIPETAVAALRNMPLHAKSGDYLFVHAGIRPGVPLNQQHDDDLLWIRDEFLDSEINHGCVVVHGHSVVEEVDIRPNRIAVDTGAWKTGRLSAVCLDGRRQSILSVQI